MMAVRAFWFFLLFTCAGLPTVASGAVVYQNTTTFTGVTHVLLAAGQTSSPEHGNQVTLGGSDRMVTGIQLRLNVLGGGVCTFKLQVRFRLNDGPGGRPGTVIWDSGPLNRLVDSGFPNPVFVAVPNVVVPDTFTYTLQITERMMNMSVFGPAEYAPPAIGSCPDGYWGRTGEGPEDWEYTGLEESPFGAHIEAVACAGTQNGDMNSDGTADGRDVSEMAAAVIAASTDSLHVCRGDFNDNGMMDPGDLPEFVQALLGE